MAAKVNCDCPHKTCSWTLWFSGGNWSSIKNIYLSVFRHGTWGLSPCCVSTFFLRVWCITPESRLKKNTSVAAISQNSKRSNNAPGHNDCSRMYTLVNQRQLVIASVLDTGGENINDWEPSWTGNLRKPPFRWRATPTPHDRWRLTNECFRVRIPPISLRMLRKFREGRKCGISGEMDV